MKNAARTVFYTAIGYVLFGALLFWPAGTFDYWQAWVFLASLAVLSIPYTVYLLVEKPEVLDRRIKSGPVAESRPIQKLAVGGLQLFFLIEMLVAGFDHRYGWSHVPLWLTVLGLVLASVGLAVSIWVVVQNSWAAATITVNDGQQLITTGLYGVVRHPMYSAALMLAMFLPLGLGSYWALLPVVVVALSVAVRAVDEEAMLRAELPGYDDYTGAVRYRLVPGAW